MDIFKLTSYFAYIVLYISLFLFAFNIYYIFVIVTKKTNLPLISAPRLSNLNIIIGLCIVLVLLLKHYHVY